MMLAVVIVGLIFAAKSLGIPSVNSGTLALWHFDEIHTPEVVSDSISILGGMPPPLIVEGKYGKALSFDGKNFVYVPFSSSLYAPDDVSLEAWIYVKVFKEVDYNNIIVIAYRSGLEWQTTTRICGMAITPSQDPLRGFLRGYVYTDRDHFNEIITTKPVIPIGKWVHVAFVRSVSTGMHLYINGEETEVNVIYGVRNPRGKILMGTEIYFGHDAEVIIDEPRVSDAALKPTQFLLTNTMELIASRTEIDVGPNLLLAITIVAVAFAAAWLLRRVIQTWGMSSRFKE
jgi:hypothetical protein